MATRNIVPRADGEGNIGTQLKNWLKGWFKNLFVSNELTDGTNSTTIADIKDAVNKRHTQNTDHIIKDADGDTLIDVEESADKDEIVGKVAGVEALRIYSSGIVDLAKQSMCGVYPSSNLSVPHDTDAVVNFDTKDFDIQNEFDTTNYRFTATVAGKYLVSVRLLWSATLDPDRAYSMRIRKNGSVYVNEVTAHASTSGASLTVSTSMIIHLDAGDYIDIVAVQWSGNTHEVAGDRRTYLSIVKVQ